MIMSETFYVANGGTLPTTAACYVKRQADDQLFDALKQAEYSYILTSRQTGKSSLLVRVALRLRQEADCAVAIIDLTKIGNQLTPEQWYDGLQLELGNQLDLSAELDDFWQEQTRLSPMNRWIAALRQVVLVRIGKPVIICIDEIDLVRSLPFSSDEFFAAIRACFNERTATPDLQRLTFCFAGVATPSELIQDTRITPFNIGRRIDLSDFSTQEAQALSQGLKRPDKQAAVLMRRVLYWSNGHPYLTQKLCQAIADDAGVSNAKGVDRLCEELFFTSRSRESENNLQHVRAMVLAKDADHAAILSLYQDIRRRKRIKDDDTNTLINHLRLAGLIWVIDDYLWVRNRIYYRVFDHDWILANMPDAEKRRQAAARREGFIRAGVLAGSVTVIVSGLAVFSLMQWQAAKHEKQHAEDTEKRRSAELFQSLLTHASLLAKGEDYSGAKQKLNETDALDKDAGPAMRHARNLLRSFTDIMGGEADAAFDGKGAGYGLVTTAISPDGQLLAAGGEHGTLVIFDAATGKLLQHLEGHATEGRAQDNAVFSIAFTPKGDTLISAGADKKIILWQRQGQSFKQQQAFAAPDKVWAIAISPDGQLLASGGTDNAVSLWSLPDGKLLQTLKQHTQTISDRGLAFSADGRYLASGSYDDTAILWEVASGKALHTLSGHNGNIHQVTFSADGQTLATASSDKTVRLWDVADGQLQRSLVGHSNNVFAVRFIGNGDTLLSAGFDRTLRLWDTKSGVTLRVLQGHESGAQQAAVYGDRLFSAGNDGSVRRWGLGLPYQQRVAIANNTPKSNAINPNLKNVAVGFGNGSLRLYDIEAGLWAWEKKQAHNDSSIKRLAFNNTGNLLASGDMDGTVKLWKVESSSSLQEQQILEEHKDTVHALSFSPDSQTLATAGYDGKIGLFKLGSQDKPRFIENAHDGGLVSVMFSQDGKQLLSAGDDRLIKLWDSQTRQGQTLAQAGDKLLWSSWSPDNQSIAAVGRSLAIDVYHTASRRLQYHLTGHEQAVFKAIFSPDSQQLATVSGDTTAKFWELGQGKELFSVHFPTEFMLPSAVWDFDFRCQATNCVMAVPLVRGLLQLYQFSYEAKPQFDANAEKRALIPLWQSYLDTVQIHLKQNALQPAAQALREADSIGKPLSAHYANDELILATQLRSHYLNVALLNKQQQTDKALEAFQQAINTVEQLIKQHPDKPDYADSLILISKQYAQLAQSEQKTALVAEIHQRLFALPLENVPALVERAEYAAQLGKQELVEKDLQTALEKVNKQNAEELNSVGYSLTNLSNRYQEAQPLLEQALVLSPDEPYILDSLGWTLFKMGQHQAALDYIQKSLAQKDKLSSNAFAEGMAHLDEIVKAMDKTKPIEISHQVVVGKVTDGSRAEKMGIKAGDIFMRYNNIPIFDTGFFISYRNQETETTPARELEVLRDGKKLMFKLTAGKIGAELKTVENSAGNAVN